MTGHDDVEVADPMTVRPEQLRRRLLHRQAVAALVAAVVALSGCTQARYDGPPAQAPAADTAMAPPEPEHTGGSPGHDTVTPGTAAQGGTRDGPTATGRTFRPSREGLPRVLRSGPSGGRRVALTFDADMTEAMLRRLETGRVTSYYNAALIDELRRQRVPATLFLTGLWMQRYPDVTRDLATDPLFELGTHTWKHGSFTADCFGLPRTRRPDMLQEVLRAQRLLDELAGPRSTKLFRFPGGCYDRAALRAIAPSDVTVVQWDVEGGDGFQPRPERIVSAVTGSVRSGSIVVLHMNGADTSPRTAEAVAVIIKKLRADGYTFTTVSGLYAKP